VQRTITILLLWKDPESLTLQEVDRFRACFPEAKINWIRTDPRNWREHRDNCRRLQADLVVHPLVHPVVDAERHVPHVAILPNGTVGLMKPLEFEKFEPRE